jgi:hypothetical protein
MYYSTILAIKIQQQKGCGLIRGYDLTDIDSNDNECIRFPSVRQINSHMQSFLPSSKDNSKGIFLNYMYLILYIIGNYVGFMMLQDISRMRNYYDFEVQRRGDGQTYSIDNSFKVNKSYYI